MRSGSTLGPPRVGGQRSPCAGHLRTGRWGTKRGPVRRNRYASRSQAPGCRVPADLADVAVPAERDHVARVVLACPCEILGARAPRSGSARPASLVGRNRSRGPVASRSAASRSIGSTCEAVGRAVLVRGNGACGRRHRTLPMRAEYARGPFPWRRIAVFENQRGPSTLDDRLGLLDRTGTRSRPPGVATSTWASPAAPGGCRAFQQRRNSASRTGMTASDHSRHRPRPTSARPASPIC